MKPMWIMAPEVFEGRPGEKLPEVVKAMGYACRTVRFDKSTLSYPKMDVVDCPVILHGPIRFVNEYSKFCNPGALGFKNNSVAEYASNVPREWLLNHDAVYTTFGQFRQDPVRFFDMLHADEVFIRPNSCYKIFTGCVVARETVDAELSAQAQTSNIFNHEIICVSTAKTIDAEFRYVIADQKVLTGSEYRWDNILDVRSDTLPICDELAKKVAEHNWQMDLAYVVDIALSNDQAKIVEFNSFSSSGLYACDLEKVVKGVSAAVEKDYHGY